MFSSVQSFSHVRLFETPWTVALQASLSITNFQSPLKPVSIELVMPSSHLIFCRPLLLLPSIFPSIRVFSKESALCIRWPEYWSFSFNISPSKEHQDWSRLERTGWISLQSKGLSRVFSNTIVQKHQFSSVLSFLYSPTFTPIHVQFSSVAQSCPTLRPRGLQHTRPPCPSPIPGAYSNLCPLSRWCHPTISSSVDPFSSCLQSCPASGSFQISRFFASGGQSIGVSASASILPMNIQDWFSLGWTGWISLLSKGLLRVFSTIVQKHTSYIRVPKYRKQILRDLMVKTDSNTVVVLLRFNISW